MSAMRRPPSAASSTTTSIRSRHSMGGPGSEQTTPRSSVASRSSIHESSMSPPLSASSAQGTARASPLARGATARAAVPPPPSRGGSANGIKRGSPVPDRSASPAMSEALEGALRREVEEKEELMARLLSRDETIAELQGQIVEMQATMGLGEGQLAELYADQERWETERAKLEDDIAKKNNVIDKLRIQLREIEKEGRDSTRRLTEQAAQFESERQAFYDNTAHLKSRIQSLTDAQKDWKQSQREASPEPDAEQGLEQDSEQPQERKVKPRASLGRPEPDEPPEMMALRLELSTLGTSHGSLGQTVKMLQSQLAEMERVNGELQEENEAFTTLLREKTLSGQIDIMRHGPDDHNDEEEQESTTGGLESELAESERQASVSPVGSRRVVSHTHSLRRPVSPARSGKSARSARRVAAETLADLPVAGPGLDLAAELGRAENWDGGVDVNEEEKEKEKEKEQEEAKVKASNAELEALRAEVKQLKDANKALSLYASKIIDRIISQEGFEHVLAVDYNGPAATPAKPKPQPKPVEKKETPKSRPGSFLARAASLSISSAAPPPVAAGPAPPRALLRIATEAAPPAVDKAEPSTPMSKRERRGLSVDWGRFNPFSRGSTEPQTPVVDPKVAGLKPLNLRADAGRSSVPASPIIQGGRKLDNEEDEEDRIERERMDAHMKLMGVDRRDSVHTPGAMVPISRGASSGADTPGSRTSGGVRPVSVRQGSTGSGVRFPTEELRAEHLELEDEAHVVAAAENHIAALDRREKVLSAELAKGRGGGFTEPPERGTRVRRRSGGSAASTLFSAGRMSRGGSEADIGEAAEETYPRLCLYSITTTMSGFALCLHGYAGPDNAHLECVPGELLYVHRIEPSGWAGAVEPDDGRWGWVPWAFVQHIDEDAVAVLWPIAPELRLGAYRAMTAIHAHATDAGYSSPDSNESDALGDEWAVAAPAAPTPKHRRPSRITREPVARPSLDLEPPAPRLPSPTEPSPERAIGVQFTLPKGRLSPRAPPPAGSPSSSFVPPRVRAFRLRSKSHDRGVRSDSESTSRPRRPSVSLRRTRMSMFGPPRGLEPHPAEELARLAARPWYLQPKHTPATGDIVIDPDGSIRAGTLEAIAERLTCDPPTRSYEHAFRRAVLLTYEAFTTSNQLFDLLTDQYALEPARQLTEEQFIEWKEARLRPTQARVLDVLGLWLALPRLYTDDPEIVLRIREFLQFVNEPDGLAAEARGHLRTIDKLINPPPVAPRQTMSPRRKTFKPRPFPTLSPPSTSTNTSPTSNPSSLLSPRLNSRHASPVPGLVETALSTSPRLEVPLPSPSFGAFPEEREGGVARRKSQRDTVSVSSRDTGSMSSLHASASPSGHSNTSPTQPTPPRPQRASGPIPSAIANIDPTALAHHLTLLEASLYMRVKRGQCLEWHRAGKAPAQEGERSKRASVGSGEIGFETTTTISAGTSSSINTAGTRLSGTTLGDLNDLREFCATNDRLAGWVKWTVLCLKTATLRAEAIGTWVRVAEKCRQLDNTSSLCAIVAGLTSSDVARLNVTASLVPTNRSQRLTELQRITSPAGSFAALKVLYASADGPGVPFVGMYLTGLVHASDQFKDVVHVPLSEPCTEDKRRENEDGGGAGKRGLLSEPATPTQTTCGPSRTLLNFTKRHKQADIIGAMLKFQQWPYTVTHTPGESASVPKQMSSPPPSTHLSPSTSPSTSTVAPFSALPSAATATSKLYPYSPSSSAPVALYASAGGVAWVEEQLGRAARITLGSDWTYERSMRLYEDEAGWTTIKDIMGEVGF
ncbi:hypothetical protein FRC10_005816 [Ceratobasidium sp. 414]|nr:hypothetical protein FRC10_005816 [Ceratobasidium sp. 414]